MTRAARRAVTSLSLAVLIAGAGCAKAILAPEEYGAVPPTRPPIAEGEPASSRNAAAARLATQYLGAPYVWAGASPGGFDCSGLVSYVYARVGVSIPHNAAQQYRHGTPVARGNLQLGDVVFFDRLRHNGIYLDDGRFIHATKPGGVKIARLDDDWFRTRWVGARRL